MEKEDGSGCRCKHTFTAIMTNEEGSSGFIGLRLILFGGATALEGNSATSPPSPASGAKISEFENTSFFFLQFWEED